MYLDSNHLRDKATKVRLDEVADDLLSAMARFQRTQKAVLAREILERGLKQMMEELNAKQDIA
jgi:predicted DNA-binding protein